MSDIETPPLPDVSTSSFKDDVLAGLRSTPKRILSKYFYDERGAKLFEEITELPEYYLTRTEIGIFEKCLPLVANELRDQMPYALIEFGTGAGVKTEMLLNALQSADAMPTRFISIDISEEQLYESARALEATFVGLIVEPLAADFSDTSNLDIPIRDGERAVYFFPGSSIGNFTPDEASDFLRALPKPATLILGVDLVKDKQIIEAAYNDALGVTAAFNLNLIDRMNRELGCGIPNDAFQHIAFFNEKESRIEMHLEATRPLTIIIGGETFRFERGERILTEYSYKYSDAMLQNVLGNAGFAPQQKWTDVNNYFAVCLCTSKS